MMPKPGPRARQPQIRNRHSEIANRKSRLTRRRGDALASSVFFASFRYFRLKPAAAEKNEKVRKNHTEGRKIKGRKIPRTHPARIFLPPIFLSKGLVACGDATKPRPGLTRRRSLAETPRRGGGRRRVVVRLLGSQPDCPGIQSVHGGRPPILVPL